MELAASQDTVASATGVGPQTQKIPCEIAETSTSEGPERKVLRCPQAAAWSHATSSLRTLANDCTLRRWWTVRVRLLSAISSMQAHNRQWSAGHIWMGHVARHRPQQERIDDQNIHQAIEVWIKILRDVCMNRSTSRMKRMQRASRGGTFRSAKVSITRSGM